MTSKVVIIGLDGATWNIIDKLIYDNKLPTFKYLIENGTKGVMESTIPPISPSAWASIYTGCKPSKHGIFGFMKRKNNSYFYRPICSNDINVPVIWDILSKNGLKSVIINAMFMYPPNPINGILITGLGTPSKDSNFVYPPSYKNFIINNFPKYDIDFNEDLLIVSDNIDGFIHIIEEITMEQMKLTKYMMKNEDWDFLFSIFRALDVVQHYFWNDKDIVYKFYNIFDDFLNDIINDYLKIHDFNLFIISDHGFSPVKKYFCVNNWLEDVGLLKTHNTRNFKLISAETFKKIFLRLKMRSLVWKLKRCNVLERILRIIPSEEFNYLNKVIWDETKAYYYEGSDGIININLVNREPLGAVTTNEYKQVLNYIVSKLNELKDPENKNKIIKGIYTKSDLFGIDDLYLHDIFILMNDGYRAVSYNKIDGRSIFMPPIHGRTLRPADHHIDGVFIAYGSNIKLNNNINKVNLWDIVPTVLYIFNIPTEPYMDGTILKDIFRDMAIIQHTSKKRYKNKKFHTKEKIKSNLRKLKRKYKV